MTKELVSKKTRYEFREFLVGWTLREISIEFDAAGITRDENFWSETSGQRRSLVEQYYHSLDFTNPVDVRKLLHAFENVLITADKKLHEGKVKEPDIKGLVDCLKRDGFKYQDGEIVPNRPEARRVFEEAQSDRSISEVTRRGIFDQLCETFGHAWYGRLEEIEFLERIFDLDSLPSTEPRFKDAREDIWQHRYNNDDWDNDWIYSDARFNLLKGPDQVFLQFLCEMVHPVVRPDTADATRFVDLFNKHLIQDGWEIVEKMKISGKPVFAARLRITGGGPPLDAVKSIAMKLDATYVSQQITRMESAVESDPELAIGTAKEFIETVCKTILQELAESLSGHEKLPQLVKKTMKKLQLLPDDIPERAKGADAIKRLLSNLATVAQGMAEVRSLYGSGHGKHAKVKGLEPRHAKLAVGAAGTLAVFLFETYQKKKE